jgi:CobQ-like glutamine amidotransferase family enzyme
MLVICGLYQLFGKGFLTVSGDKIPGIGIFNASTYAGNTRMIGNMVVESKIGLLVGFENHSGQTVLNAGQAPLGITSKGQGNTTNSQQEGAITNEVIGTYLHGPVLPKNPSLADHLLLAALQLRYGVLELQPLQDTLEQDAAKVAASRPK